MANYSDPTADQALGSINREFSRLEKKAKRIAELYQKGLLSEEALKEAGRQFTGIFRYVLINALKDAK